MRRNPPLPMMVACLALGGAAPAFAQVQPPPNTVPAGEGRLPSQPGTQPPGGAPNECRRQLEAVRNQYQIQESALRREMADRARLADDTQKERLRAEQEQRLQALRAEAQQAERSVRQTCTG